MKVIANGQTFDLGTTETGPTIGITDFSRRVTDDFGVTTVVERAFAKRMSVRFTLPASSADALQRKLTGLRASSALWIADERFSSLSFTGFYKDFDVDLSGASLCYCTLSVEGLAEAQPAPDSGLDPATDGTTSKLQLLQPLPVAGDMLAVSNVPEADYPEWSSGTSYGIGARVIKGATHRIYESGAAGNVSNDPTGTSGKWIDVGPTNRWAMFDQALGSVTSQAGSIAVTIAPGAAVTAVALLDVHGATVRVQADGYDQTQAVSAGGSALFLDMPGGTANVTVTVAGSGTVEVGTMLIGRLVKLGTTEASPTAGITDFSRKEVDDFGAVTVVERAYAKRMAAKALIRTDAVDVVAARIAAVRARPSLWIGDAGLESLIIYGFFKDFSIEVGENVSKLSLSIEGLSTAGKVEPFAPGGDAGPVKWPDIIDSDPARPKPQNGADVTSQHTAKDTANIGGEATTTVKERIKLAVERADGALKTTDDLLKTYGKTEAASASAEAARLSAESADGKAQVATAKANAAAFSSSLAARGPSLLENDHFALWPDGQPLPSAWTPWTVEGGGQIIRAEPGQNGFPFSVRMVSAADANIGIVQRIVKAFGAFSLQFSIKADNHSGAGLLIQAVKADGSAWNGGAADRVYSFLSATDTSSWPGGPDGFGGNYERTFTWYYDTPVNGEIAGYFVYLMANWEGFGAPRRAKTIEFRCVEMRPANAVELETKNPVSGLGSKASHEEVITVASDKAGNALIKAREEYSAQFSGITPSGLSGLIAGRPTYTEVAGNVSTAIDIATGPDGVVAKRAQIVSAGIGGNLIGPILSTAGWVESGPGGMAEAGLNIAGINWKLDAENNIGFRQDAGEPSQYRDWETLPAATTNGQIYQAFGMGASHRCDVDCYIHRYDTNGNHVDYIYLGRRSRGLSSNGGRDPNSWDVWGGNFTAVGPTAILFRKMGTNPGGADSYAWFTRPQIVKVPSADFPLLAYMPGADTATSGITQGAIADLKGKTQAFLEQRVAAGPNTARVSLVASNGPNPGDRYAQILLDAPEVLVSGNLLVGGSVNFGALAPGATFYDVFTLGSERPTGSGWVDICSITYKPQDPTSRLFVFYTGVSSISTGSPSGTVMYATISGGGPGPPVVNQTKGDFNVLFGSEFSASGAGAERTYTLSMRASNGVGQGDPHYMNGRIYIIEFKRGA